MNTQLLISGVIFGLSIGSIFFLLAIGLSLCFGLMRIISLDQLLYYSVGAFISYSLYVATGNTWFGTLSGLSGALHAPLIMVDPHMGLHVLAFVFMVVIIGGLGSIKGTLASAFIAGQVISLGSLIYAPLAQMAPFAIMLLILLIKPTGLYGSKLLKR